MQTTTLGKNIFNKTIDMLKYNKRHRNIANFKIKVFFRIKQNMGVTMGMRVFILFLALMDVGGRKNGIS